MAATTPFTFQPRPTAPFVAGQGTLTVNGDIQAIATFSRSSCNGITVTKPNGVLASLAFVSDAGSPSAKTYVLDVAGVSPGRTAFPEPEGFNQVPPRRIRLSVDGPDPLTWGTTAAGQGTVSGTLTAKIADARSGTFDLQLGFAGSERGTVPLSAHQPVRVAGSWDCG